MRTRRCRSRETLACRSASAAPSTGPSQTPANQAATQPSSDSTSKVRPRTAPTIADKRDHAEHREVDPADRDRLGHGRRSQREQHGVEAGGLGLGERRLGLAARSERADADADAAAGRRLRDLRVSLQAELLDVLARLARGLGVGEGADLDDEALLVGARDRPAFEQRAGARLAVGASAAAAGAAGAAASARARGAARRLGGRACATVVRGARSARRAGVTSRPASALDSVITPSPPRGAGIGVRPAAAGAVPAAPRRTRRRSAPAVSAHAAAASPAAAARRGAGSRSARRPGSAAAASRRRAESR